MEILHLYKKKRRQFGPPVSFNTSEPAVLLDVRPQMQQQRRFIRRNPVTRCVEAGPSSSVHEVNTEITSLSHRGMLHLEGGWPKDVNPDDLDSKTRFQKKEERSDEFIAALKRNADVMDVYLRQNIAIDMYETYFKGRKYDPAVIFRQTMAKSSATVLTVLKDPCEGHKRAALGVSWFPPDGSKIAVAYSVPHAQMIPSSMDYRSCVWDIRNPNEPELYLAPSSPLTCIDYNARDTPYVISGAANGCLFVFDTRRGSQPIDYSLPANSHKDPVYSVKWIQSKSNAECVSISTDGQILLWDARALGAPMERHQLLQKSNPRTGLLYDGMMGATALHYDTTYSASKFLIGTEQGYALNWNRRTKREDKVERAFSGHHGPICAVQRNPFINKYFLSVGDWTARIFSDELRKPVMETSYQETLLSSACWSNSRPGVFFTVKVDGSMDVWDIVYDHAKPMISVSMSTEPLYSIQDYGGRFLACGDGAGSTFYVELSDDLSGCIDGDKLSPNDERQAILEVLDREYVREKALEGRRAELENKSKQAAQISARRSTQGKTTMSPTAAATTQQAQNDSGGEEESPEMELITDDFFQAIRESDDQEGEAT